MRGHIADKIRGGRDNWQAALEYLGVSGDFLRLKPGPCPICKDGEDRFVFDNKYGNGNWYCRRCDRAGDGIELAKAVTGKSYLEISNEIDAFLGDIDTREKASPSKPAEISDAQHSANRKKLWDQGAPVQSGDLVDEYLRRRCLDELQYPSCLRFVSKAYDGDGCVRPAMIARVIAHDNSVSTVHRTFLHPDGTRKAEMRSPRKLMPGKFPLGGAVRLGAWTGGILGIAEGIETAMAASHEFQMPVWAALNANMLLQWIPPAGCCEVAIFGDNDESYTGQAVAFGLAKRLRTQGLAVEVHIPPGVGDDWADVWLRRHAKPGAHFQFPIAAE